jgi:hypothetical protein
MGEWIKAGEGSPEEDVQLLVYTEQLLPKWKTGREAELTHDVYFGYYKAGAFEIEDWLGNSSDAIVTHWQPLPPPPN